MHAHACISFNSYLRYYDRELINAPPSSSLIDPWRHAEHFSNQTLSLLGSNFDDCFAQFN